MHFLFVFLQIYIWIFEKKNWFINFFYMFNLKFYSIFYIIYYNFLLKKNNVKKTL